MEHKQYYVLDYDFNLLPEEQRDFAYELWDAGNGNYILVIDEADVVRVRSYITKYPYIPKIYGLSEITDDIESARNGLALEPLATSGILRMQEPPLSLSGQGVILAIIDTGIQYELDAFRYQNGDSRILSIWDQTIEGEQYDKPEGFQYGREFDTRILNEALRNDNPLAIAPTTDTNGHGTALASIAGGSIADTTRGAAYNCQFVIVKLRRAPGYLTSYYGVSEDTVCYADFDIMMAVRYVQQFQKAFKKPIVILLGMQTNQGNHTGNAMLPATLSAAGKARNQIVVTPAGNEGEAAGHYHGVIEKGNGANGDVCELLVGEGEGNLIMELWGKPPVLFSVGISSPAGEQIVNAPYRPGQSVRYDFLYSQTVVTIDYVSTDQTSGQELVLIGLENPLAGIWQIHVTSYGSYQEGSFDIWLPVNSFLTGDTRFLRPEPETTITEPACGGGVISVGAYQSVNGSFFQKSGRGYLTDGQIKPDLVAPGVAVPTAIGARSGTSYAAALCAGAAAQFLEWSVVRKNDLFVNTAILKNILIRGATREMYPFYPNPLYGYGALNLAKSFDLLAGISPDF